MERDIRNVNLSGKAHAIQPDAPTSEIELKPCPFFEGVPLMVPNNGDEPLAVTASFHAEARTWAEIGDHLECQPLVDKTPLVAGGQGRDAGEIIDQSCWLFAAVVGGIVFVLGLVVGLAVPSCSNSPRAGEVGK